MTGYLHDSDGNRSSKRLAGFCGLAVMTLLSAVAVWRAPNTAVDLVSTWALFSGGCLGLGVAEKFAPRGNTPQKREQP